MACTRGFYVHLASFSLLLPILFFKDGSLYRIFSLAPTIKRLLVMYMYVHEMNEQWAAPLFLQGGLTERVFL